MSSKDVVTLLMIADGIDLMSVMGGGGSTAHMTARMSTITSSLIMRRLGCCRGSSDEESREDRGRSK